MTDDRKMTDTLDPKVWLDGAPLLKPSIDGHKANLMENWRVKWKRYVIVNSKVPFFTDFASIPATVRAIFARIFPARSIYDFAALAHDIAYKNGYAHLEGVMIPFTRDQADEMFYDLMVDLVNGLKPNWFMRGYYITRAKLMYQMVSWFGGSTWDEYRKPKPVDRKAVDSARERMKR
jgi:hypothetical protein